MITLEANYSKKIGLPGYSSHQFSITLRTEVQDITQVQSESDRLYSLLQQGVDNSIKQVGFLPTQGNPAQNGHARNGGHGQPELPAATESWSCTPKQKDLILGLAIDHSLSRDYVENLAQSMFRKPVRQLNKLEASGLIDELIEKHGKKQNGRYSQPGARR